VFGTLITLSNQSGEQLMQRLYFLLPDVNMVSKVVDELLLARVDEHHMHVIGNEDEDLKDLPMASFLQTSDFIPSMERGVVVGGIAGVLACLMLFNFAPNDAYMGMGAFAVAIIISAIAGAWVSSMIGINVENSQIKRFHKALEMGKMLLMVDVPKQRVAMIEQQISQHYPRAESKGLEPSLPVFP